MIRALLAESLRRNRLLATFSLAHFVLFLVLIPAAFLDPVQILGISRWVKPMKFAISIAIFLMTMAWLLSYLERSRRAVSVLSAVIGFTMTVEIVLITMQAARRVRSHFNIDSAFDSKVFDIMGAMILANTVAVVFTWLLFLRRDTKVQGAHLSGIRLGLMLFILASLLGGLMVQRGSHGVGVHDGSPGLPFVNWSTGGGDLRVAHFFGMHSLQALPIFGWFLDRRRSRNGRLWVQLTAAVFAAVTTMLVVQALAGKPLIEAGAELQWPSPSGKEMSWVSS